MQAFKKEELSYFWKLYAKFEKRIRTFHIKRESWTFSF